MKPGGKKTIVGVKPEGHRDTGFMEYLHKLYHIMGRKIIIKNGHGGDPLAQQKSIETEYRFRACDEIHQLYDTDIEKTKEGKEILRQVRKNAKKKNYILHESIDNVDYKLLELLDPPRKVLNRAKQSTDEAKKVLRELCRLKKKDSPIEWEKYFPKSLLDEKRKGNSWLDDLIKIITG